MAATLQREIAEISRSSEFFSVSELEAQTGQPKEKFAEVALKELMDNAIDAAEAASSQPEVSLDITVGENSIHLSVQDNGPGISPETIDRIKDFDVRVTDKLNYRSPSRGQQGNALKTILGLPYALGSKEPITVRSNGIEHTIYASPDPLGHVNVTHDKTVINGTKGTTVALTLPLRYQVALRHWARAYALSNPHVLVKIRRSFDGSYKITPRTWTTRKSRLLTIRRFRSISSGANSWSMI
jgi:DNA topoisomerase VI subunit B